ncbi:hypothetical protein KJ966_06650 [bacterium]|nr:hypothetical protein [bacterium]
MFIVNSTKKKTLIGYFSLLILLIPITGFGDFKTQKVNSLGFEVEIWSYRVWNLIQKKQATDRAVIFTPYEWDEDTLFKYDDVVLDYPLFKILSDNCGDVADDVRAYGSCAPEFVSAPLPLYQMDTSNDHLPYWSNAIKGLAGIVHAFETATRQATNADRIFIIEEKGETPEEVLKTGSGQLYDNSKLSFEDMSPSNVVINALKADLRNAGLNDTKIIGGNFARWSDYTYLDASYDTAGQPWWINTGNYNGLAYQATIGVPFIYVGSENLIKKSRTGVGQKKIEDLWKSSNQAGNKCFECLCNAKIRYKNDAEVNIFETTPVNREMIAYYQFRNLFHYMNYLMILYSNVEEEAKFDVGGLFFKVNPIHLTNEVINQFVKEFKYDNGTSAETLKTDLFDKMTSGNCQDQCYKYPLSTYPDTYKDIKKARDGGYRTSLTKETDAQNDRKKIIEWFLKGTKPAADNKLEDFLAIGINGYLLKPYRIQAEGETGLLYIVTELRNPGYNNVISKLESLFEDELKIIGGGESDPMIHKSAQDVSGDGSLNNKIQSAIQSINKTLVKIYDTTTDARQFGINVNMFNP